MNNEPTALDLKRPYTFVFDRYWRIEWGGIERWASLSYRPGTQRPYRLSLVTPAGSKGFACAYDFTVNAKLRGWFNDTDLDIHGSYKLKEIREPSV